MVVMGFELRARLSEGGLGRIKGAFVGCAMRKYQDCWYDVRAVTCGRKEG